MPRDDLEIAVVGESAKLKGQLETPNLLIIEGEFSGSIRCPYLVVTRGGRVNGWVEVEEVEVWGNISGFVKVRRMVCRNASRIGGCILVRSVALEPGALVEGFLTFQRSEEERDERKTGSER